MKLQKYVKFKYQNRNPGHWFIPIMSKKYTHKFLTHDWIPTLIADSPISRRHLFSFHLYLTQLEKCECGVVGSGQLLSWFAAVQSHPHSSRGEKWRKKQTYKHTKTKTNSQIYLQLPKIIQTSSSPPETTRDVCSVGLLGYL